MSEFTGKDMYFEWVYSGGTVTLHGDFRTVTLSPSIDYADATAGSDARRKRIATIADASVSFSGLMQAAGTALEDALAEGTEGTINFGPRGTTAGYRKYVVGAFAGGANVSIPYSDVVEFSVNFTGNGTYSRTTY